MLATALTVMAIVTQDQTALRAAARDSSAQQAVLWQGDSLEVRGEKGDYLQVYDHRRERAGYVRASLVRVQSLAPEAAPELLGIVRFLKDAPGSEALGIAYTAAYLRAAPAESISSEAFDALNQLADRLARRATAGRSGKAGETLAAHLEVAAHYGVSMTSFERDGQVQLCPNGDAARRVLAMPSTAIQKALAALNLTRHECISPALTPVERYAVDQWRSEVLDRVETAKLPPVLQNRVHLRRAGVWASLAYQRARKEGTEAASVREAGQRAVDALAAINPKELMETDLPAYNDAAVRVGASRWAALPPAPPPALNGKQVGVVMSRGEGTTCISLVDPARGPEKPLLSRCTYGVVWPASLSTSAQGDALTLAVQPLDNWREMWVLRKGADGWQLDILPPGTESSTPGYIEFAGWVPDGERLLAAREAYSGGRLRTSFESLRRDTLAVEKQADKPANLSVFYRWQSPVWKAGTVSVR